MEDLASQLEITVEDIVLYVNTKSYQFEEYVDLETLVFSECILKDDFVEEIISTFSYRKENNEKGYSLIEQMREARKSKNKKGFRRPEEAKNYIISEVNKADQEFDVISRKNILFKKREKYKKWIKKEERNKKENYEKAKRIEKKLEGTDISVKIDKKGRALYYRVPGEWIKHEAVGKIIKG